MSHDSPPHPTLRRIEASRLGSAAASAWRGAAYDHPTDRTPTAWAMQGLVLAFIGMALAIGRWLAHEAVARAVALPPPESVVGYLLSVGPTVADAATTFVLALSAMYLAKLLVAIVADEWGEEA